MCAIQITFMAAPSCFPVFQNARAPGPARGLGRPRPPQIQRDGEIKTGEQVRHVSVSRVFRPCLNAVPQMRLSNVSRTLTDLCVVSAWSQQ